MAKPIKDTPVLRGSDAVRFQREVEDNSKLDHSASYQRARAVYLRFQSAMKMTSNAEPTVAR
jgi:hypothetical protein